MKIKEVMNKIESYLLDKEANDYEFSTWLEDTLAFQSNTLRLENDKIASKLINELPWICDMTEPGQKSPEFKIQLNDKFYEIKRSLETELLTLSNN